MRLVRSARRGGAVVGNMLPQDETLLGGRRWKSREGLPRLGQNLRRRARKWELGDALVLHASPDHV